MGLKKGLWNDRLLVAIDKEHKDQGQKTKKYSQLGPVNVKPKNNLVNVQ